MTRAMFTAYAQLCCNRAHATMHACTHAHAPIAAPWHSTPAHSHTSTYGLYAATVYVTMTNDTKPKKMRPSPFCWIVSLSCDFPASPCEVSLMISWICPKRSDCRSSAATTALVCSPCSPLIYFLSHADDYDIAVYGVLVGNPT